MLLLSFIPLLQAKPISVHTHVESVRLAVAELSRAASMKMQVTGEVAKEIVYLNVKDRPLTEVMANLGHCVFAEWIKENDGSLTLRRPDWIVTEAIQQERTDRYERIKAEVAKLQQGLNLSFDPDTLKRVAAEHSQLEGKEETERGQLSNEEQLKIQDRIEEMAAYDPSLRALARCLNDVDLEYIASLPEGGRAVYVFDPNRVQFSLGQNSRDALSELPGEQMKWGAALLSVPIRKDQDPERRFSTDSDIDFFKGEMPGMFEPWGRTKPFPAAFDSTMLAVTNAGNGEYALDQTLYVGTKAAAVIRTRLNAGIPFESQRVEDKPGKQIRYSPIARSLLKLTGDNPPTRAALREISQLIGPYFIDSEHKEPLSICNDDALDTVADFERKSVVACLEDDMVIPYGSDTREYLSGFRYDLTREERDGWILLRPKSLLHHRKTLIDRKALSSYAKSLIKNGEIELDPFVAVFLASGFERNPLLSLSEHLLPESAYGSGSIKLPSVQLVRFYAGLTTDQKSKLAAGETVAYSDLSPDQQSLAALIVYGSRSIGEDMFDFAAAGRPYQDATYELPDGVTQGMGIRGKWTTERIVVFHNGLGGPSDEFISENIDAPPSLVYSGGPAPELPPGGISFAKYDIRTTRFLTLDLGLRPGHWIRARFGEPCKPQKDKPVTLDKLPADVQARVKKIIKSFEPDGSLQGHGAGKPPPAQS